MSTHLTGVVGYIHAHLDQDLNLEMLASRTPWTASHFHRKFKDYAGETPAKYVERIRLEQAASALVLHNPNVLDIGLDLCFGNPETFTLAFQRLHRLAPREYRNRGRLQSVRALPDRRPIEQAQASYELSASRVVELRPVRLACKRHIGSYEQVPTKLWQDIEAHLSKQKITGSRFLGIGHDMPGPKARFDAAIVIEQPFIEDDKVFSAELPPGLFAITSHVGAYSTLPFALENVYRQATELPDFQLLGLPLIELYHSSHMQTDRKIEQTDIYMPVSPIDRAGKTDN